MTEQLLLLDVATAVPAPPKLKPRQAFALKLVTEAGVDGIHADEVGAGWCAQRGKHSVDERCRFDGANGNQVLRALRAKGLVRYRRRKADGTGGDWVTADAGTPPARGMLADDEAIPF